MTTTRSSPRGWRWLSLVVFSILAVVCLFGSVVCLLQLVQSGHIALTGPEDPETKHFGVGAIGLVALGFLMAAACLACGISIFREKET